MWLLIGDPHFEVKNLDLMKRATDEILDLIDRRKPEACVVLGDTLHTHEKLHLLALTQAVTWLRSIAERCHLYLLIGNHDRINNQDFMSPIHPFVGLKETQNITVVDTSIWDKASNCVFVPYVPPGRFHEALVATGYTPGDNTSPAAIFAHQEFRGCKLGNAPSTDGDVWSDAYPTVYSGHIHMYHTLPGVVYVGTFHQQNYGEDADKAVMFLENGKTSRVPLMSIPTRVTLKTTLNSLPDLEIPPQHRVRVVINVDATDRKKVEQSPHYKSLCETVDRVTLHVTGDKGNLAQSMVEQMKDKGHLEKRNDASGYTINEIVKGMLADDTSTLRLYTEEIAA